MRSDLVVGSTKWVVQRAQWGAMGISPDEYHKPKIAVVNSSSQLSSCFSHIDQLAIDVADAVREAGGLPFEIRTCAPSDFMTAMGHQGRYLLPSRDLMVNDIEVAVEGGMLDGMICLSSCDKTAPAHMMAAGRINVPTILVIGGYQAGGHCAGKKVNIIDAFEASGAYAANKISLDELRELADNSITTPGVCAGLGTANTMHSLAEVMGMTLPFAAPVLAGSERMRENARAAGRRIVELIREDLKPRDILTEAALTNAVIVDLAISGSVNSPRHLQAIATEAGLDIDIFALIEELSPKTPMIAAIQPNGSHEIDDFERAGGVQAVLARLADRLDLDHVGVSGQSTRELIEQFEPIDADVVRSIDQAYSPESGLTLVRGSLAPLGAVVKVGAFGDAELCFTGPAKVFDSGEDAQASLAVGGIVAGDVVVLRGGGPKGGPGTVMSASFVAALFGAGLGGVVAVVTDGELSGLNHGIAVGGVMPEAAEGGPIALVETGDQVEIDLVGRRLELAVSDSELAARRERLDQLAPTEGTYQRGWLAFYRTLVTPLREGAVLQAKP
ncbi:dihydroxy-acid dehydratase [Mycobacterium sp. AMU20-3851]|uniref:dihydroxy-acid dehydratase n=1 Tax=Mycobacterium sp. AMU20-3851 TaxID=3122055 RepID=UPI003754FF2B